MQLRATTIGAGPYRPAIKWTGEDGAERTWAHPSRTFDKEDDAAEFASKVMTQVGDGVNEALTCEGFVKEE